MNNSSGVSSCSVKGLPVCEWRMSLLELYHLTIRVSASWSTILPVQVQIPSQYSISTPELKAVVAQEVKTLLKKIFLLEKKDRISIDQVIKHSFFTG